MLKKGTISRVASVGGRYELVGADSMVTTECNFYPYPVSLLSLFCLLETRRMDGV